MTLRHLNAIVERTPEASALVCGDERLSYRELSERAGRLARRLRGLGVGPDRLVAVCLERSLEMAVGVLAILEAGGVTLPLDPAGPRRRLAFMLEDARPEVVLSRRRLADRLPRHSAQQLWLDAPDGAPPVASTAAVARTSPESLAYVIYTSGSTGRPKGVAMSHRGLGNLIAWHLASPRLSRPARTLQLTTLAFDVAFQEMFSTWCTGGTLVLAAAGVRRDPAALRRFLRQQEIERIFLPFVALEQLAEASRGRPAVPETLRDVITAGEQLLCTEPVRELFEHLPGGALHNHYGPTETHVVTACDLTAPAAGWPDLPPIGRPIEGVTIHLVDPRLHRRPAGAVGELAVGGEALARGYLRRPAQTAERFVPDPFSRRPGARLYRTGDLARRLADGVFAFLGRDDDQIKIRGVRAELGEIASVLRHHPAVREATVLARRPSSGRGGAAGGEPRLAAYLVADAAAPAARRRRRRWWRESVDHWRSIYDSTYQQGSPAEDPELDLAGWISSYTGEPIPAEEMRSAVESTVERIRGLRPERVLEIGCGTGLLLFRLAPGCACYHGTDLSPAVIATLGARLGPELSEVTLRAQPADDFSGIEPGGYDTVVCNSVAGHFPDIDYLMEVLAGMARAAAPGGALFLGDVDNLPLLEALAASVELCRAPAESSAAELRRRIRRRLLRHDRLAVDPAFFFAARRHLPRLREVRILPRPGRHGNELRFRYDAILHLDRGAEGEASPGGEPAAPRRLDWRRDALSLATLRDVLATEAPPALLLCGVPHAHLARDQALLAALGETAAAVRVAELRRRLRRLPPHGIAPGELRQMLRGSPYHCEPSWARGLPDGSYDVTIWRAEAPRPAAPAPPAARQRRPWRAGANNPLRGLEESWLVPRLRDFLRSRLPEAMIPASFVLLDALPLSANGKVDRRALPLPERSRPPLRSPFVAPRTPLEETLRDLWEELLDVTGIGVRDSFLELGGHSLLATRAVSRIRRRLGVELAVRQTLGSVTIAELAEHLEEARGAGDRTAEPPIERIPRDGELPLSFAQQRLWFLDQLEPGSGTYNVPTGFELTGPLYVAALRRGLAEVVRRHEVLRTSFPSFEGSPRLAIREAPELDFAVVDLTRLAGPARRRAARRLAREDASRPFDLARGPLLRGRLLRLAPTRHILLLNLHHIVCDGWSLGVLQGELSTLYGSFSRGEPSPLAELAVQVADVAAWQRRWLRGAVLERLVERWRRQLGGVPPALALPYDRPRPARPTYRGGKRPLRLSAALSRRVEELGAGQGATPFMVLLAVLGGVLSRWSDGDRVVVGTDFAGRDRLETEALIGFFVNVLPLAADVRGDPSLRQLVGRVRETTLRAHADQGLPFDRLVAELKPQRTLGATPLVQVMFLFQSFPRQPLDLAGLSVRPLEDAAVTSRFDLLLIAEPTEADIRGAWIYRTELFDPATVEAIARDFETLLERAVSAPDLPSSRWRQGTAGHGHTTPGSPHRRKRVMNESAPEKPRLAARRRQRRGVRLAKLELVRITELAAGQRLPLLAEPATADVDLAEWAAAERTALEGRLRRRGAILFRGFGVRSVTAFERFAGAVCDELYDGYGDLPREDVGASTYTSTFYPPDRFIHFHNESSQLHCWPLKQMFCCLQAARKGGETPITDGREVYKALDPALRRRFRDQGLVYVRNFVEGLDVSWQEFFATAERDQVEATCRGADIEVDWRPGGGLRTFKRAPAVARHPQTGETVFFNQIQVHHPALLEPEERESLVSMLGEDGLPRDVRFGDGTPIEASIVEELVAVYRELSVRFRWCEGDVLLLDNMLIAHSRNPFAGERKIIVAMGEMVQAGDVLR